MENLVNIKNFIMENKYAIIYFGTQSCSVCHGVEPQVKNLLKEYLDIKSKFIWINAKNEIIGEFQIFTFPVLIMFIDGKEVFRMARFIPMTDLKNKIDRLMNFID